MNKERYELSVIATNSGKPMREYFHKNRFFVEAKKNTEYTIKLKNHSSKKILAVVSVDGVEVLKGGNAADCSSGYVVNPFSTLNVNGYRIDDNNVASFKFDEGKTSYASLVENDFSEQKAAESPSRNNGVIGVRIWEEKEGKFIPAWKSEPYKSPKSYFYNSNNPFNYGGGLLSGMNCVTGSYFGAVGSGCGINFLGAVSGCSSSAARTVYSSDTLGFYASNCSVSTPDYVPQFELGTAWGKQVEDKVIKTTFEKAESFTDLEIFYLKREELVKMGVDVENAKKVFVSGFPEAFSNGEYCKKPSNWNK